ncbi:MAG: type IV toxin-antitoxin system AbiEi family antitoxin domain-containing protein [Mycobacteriales bacterium]
MEPTTRTPAKQRLQALPVTFTYSQAIRSGLSDRPLYRLRDQGLVEVLGRGLYRRSDVSAIPGDSGTGEPVDIELLEIAHRAPRATLCLVTALAHHGLIDDVPVAIDIALPRGYRRPATTIPVAWHAFSPATFDIGRTLLRVDTETHIGLYGPQRCLIDAFRLAHREGEDLAATALKRWVRRPDGTPAELLDMTQNFPAVRRGLRQALVTLL